MIAAVNQLLAQPFAPVVPRAMTIAVSGASGLVGSALSKAIIDRSWKLRRLVRGNSSGGQGANIPWNPESGLVNFTGLSGVDAIVHLAGDNIANGRWTPAKKLRIRDSRVNVTQRLCKSLAAMSNPPRVLVCASAIGYYGDRGDHPLGESELPGRGFLPEVCTQWERATQPAVDAGIRVVQMRIGVVLSPDGGALKQMLLPFQFGLGGKIGSGRQYWSWISLPDLVRSILLAVEEESLAGPVNAVAPDAVTNSEFTRVLGRVLRRPTLFPLPGFMARLVLGEMADELLLASIRVAPEQLQKHGFKFEHPDLETALRAVLNRERPSKK